MKGREKSEKRRRIEDSDSEKRLYSKGVAMLVFIMLAVQFIFFAGYIIKNFFIRNNKNLSVEEVIPDEENQISPSDEESKSYEKLKFDDKSESNEHSKSGKNFNSENKFHPATVSKERLFSNNSNKQSGCKTGISLKQKEKSSPVKLDYDGWKWDMVELNSADSATLVGLPGIGPYYAKKILLYREKLWGCYADKRQLLEISGIDSALFRKIENRIYIEPSFIRSIDLYALSADSLSHHPYIGYYASRGIVKFREMVKREEFTLQALLKNHIISEKQAKRLALYMK